LSCRADVKKPLTVSYTNSSLAAGIFQRYDGMLESSRQALDLDLGAEGILREESVGKYWAVVKKFVQEVIRDEEVSALLLLG
jgi:hypothetical protein